LFINIVVFNLLKFTVILIKETGDYITASIDAKIAAYYL